jgi:hypothetical protein
MRVDRSATLHVTDLASALGPPLFLFTAEKAGVIVDPRKDAAKSIAHMMTANRISP